MKADLTFGLKVESLEKIQRVFMNFPEVEKCVVYGSRAMGSYQYNSDIDLTLIGKNLSLT